jgi:hypothetical protein
MAAKQGPSILFLVLFGMQNRTLGPHSGANTRIGTISMPNGTNCHFGDDPTPGAQGRLGAARRAP